MIMPKNKFNPINRKLKKADVRDYIENHGAKLHEEYTKFHYQDYGTGYVRQDYVYELPTATLFLFLIPKVMLRLEKELIMKETAF